MGEHDFFHVKLRKPSKPNNHRKRYNKKANMHARIRQNKKTTAYLSEKVKHARENGEVWFTVDGIRYKGIPYENLEDEFYLNNFSGRKALIKGQGHIRLIELIDKDGLKAIWKSRCFHIKESAILLMVMEEHPRVS